MNPPKWIKLNVISLFQYLLMFIIIVYGQTVWMRIEFIPGIVTHRSEVLSALAALTLIILLILNKKISKKGLRTAALLGLVLLLYFILSFFKGWKYILLLAVNLCLMTIYLRSLWVTGKVEELVKKYSDIIVVLAAISLVLYFAGPILHLIPSRLVHYFWADKHQTCRTYFHLLYETQTQDFFGTTFIRNCGIFAEAPSYAVPLVLSLFYQMFIQKKNNLARKFILLAAIITSFSTKGLLLLFVMMGLKMIDSAYFNATPNRYKQIFRLFVPVAIVVVSFVAIAVFEQKTDSNSYISRIDNIQSTLLAFKDNWLLGVGLGNEGLVSQYSSLVLERYGFSIGATLLLAQGGLYMTSFYLGSFIWSLINSRSKRLVVYTFITYLGILFTSNITYFLSTIFILALGYSKPRIKRLENS